MTTTRGCERCGGPKRPWQRFCGAGCSAAHEMKLPLEPAPDTGGPSGAAQEPADAMHGALRLSHRDLTVDGRIVRPTRG